MWKTKILATGFAIAISMMLLTISAAPVAAAGARYQLELAGKAKQGGGPNPWQPASIVLPYAELPAIANVTIGNNLYFEQIVSIQYVFDPNGVQGVDIGDIWINFTKGSISGTITYGMKTYNYPSTYMYLEVAGLGGRVLITSINTYYNFASVSGTCEIGSSGGTLPPESQD